MENLKSKIQEQGYNIPYSENLSVLCAPITVSGKVAPNRIAIQPMEGCDGTADGAFGELTHRRYERFAKSGAGLIWAEACAVVNEGRANPRQLFLTEKNLDSFKYEVEFMRETAMKENGINPVIILQATHSGRYSKPQGTPAPLIAYNKPIFEKDNPIDASHILSDDYLKALEEKFGLTAKLAEQAGFDGVDIKCCHGYLMSELMGAHVRKGEYGGSYENRTRLYFNSIAQAKQNTGKDFIVTSRMNAYDGFPYPYGFGVTEEKGLTPVLDEPLQVVKTLKEKFDFELLDITIGNPYVNPHVNRPFNHGPYESPEAPLTGVERMMKCVGKIQQENPDMVIMGSGFSYMGKESENVAAGAVENGVCKIAGFGRQAFAYPDFAKDMLSGGAKQEKCCIACGKCSELMRAGTVAGCVIRDSETYMPYYKQYVLKK
ncbi:MAG: flavin oxidoreductase/NADH oxidase [Clostridia bacterium]|nr:flavin oxidoreductase/NADH oxidase [Clostridia bacterium]